MDIGRDLLTDDTQQEITIPADLVQQIDDFLGTEHETREEFVKAAIRHYVQSLNLPPFTSSAEEYPETK